MAPLPPPPAHTSGRSPRDCKRIPKALRSCYQTAYLIACDLGFDSMPSAVIAARHYQLQNVDLVLVVNDEPQPEWDVVLPLIGTRSAAFEQQ